MNLDTPISQLRLVGPWYAKKLSRMEIYTAKDLLIHLPTRYQDFSDNVPIAQGVIGQTITIKGVVEKIKNAYTRFGKVITTATIKDSTGAIETIWFNQPYLTKTILPGAEMSASGQVKTFRGKSVLIAPEYELVLDKQSNSSTHTGRLVPIYSETSGVSSRWLRSRIRSILADIISQINDWLPQKVREKHQLTPLAWALEQVHFPDNPGNAMLARKRLAFDELLILQLKSLLTKKDWQDKKKAIPFKIDKLKLLNLISSLPFSLTQAQKRVAREILKDLTLDRPMNRLLEGDVGCGKTVIAALAMHLAWDNGYQSLLMAPTEILAHQHFNTISSLLSATGIKIGLQTGSIKMVSGSGKKNSSTGGITKSSTNLKGDYDIIVGTHALLTSGFENLGVGLIVIDEQHRFGVTQRALLRDKPSSSRTHTPHFLTMTATPIPRTLALTFYGDLDLSVIDQLPPGRLKTKTFVVPPAKRQPAYNFINDHVKIGQQAFIICPLIEPSETLSSVKSATEEYHKLKTTVFPHLRLGLLHGRLSSKAKRETLEQFHDHQLDILVATPVVEVGIDVANATIMVIEAAERFGLAQLHQLRGRVGRGNLQSYCLLFSQSSYPPTLNRLKFLEKIHNGLELAEIDLKLRGAGELYGTKQHGVPQLSAASLTDVALMEETKQVAIELTQDNYPDLLPSQLFLVREKTDLVYPD